MTYGIDISATFDLDPLLSQVEGDELMRQVCVRRLFCRAGSLLSNPLDNTIDVRDFLNGQIRGASVARIQGACSSALLGDPRILEAAVRAEFVLQSGRAGALVLQIRCVGSEGPFELVVKVTSLTVELLRSS